MTEEFEQAEATIESLTLQGKRDADDLALLRKRVTELEDQNKTEILKYQGEAPLSLPLLHILALIHTFPLISSLRYLHPSIHIKTKSCCPLRLRPR